MKRCIIFALVLFGLVAASCHKTVVDCEYTVRPMIQVIKDTVTLMALDSRAYAFYVDPEQWTVDSYEDALQGIITNLDSGEKKSFDFYDEPAGKEQFNFVFDQLNVMLVVCHTQKPMHAWRSAGVQPDIRQMNISLLFKPWLVDSTYTESKWSIVNGKTYPNVWWPWDAEDSQNETSTDEGR